MVLAHSSRDPGTHASRTPPGGGKKVAHFIYSTPAGARAYFVYYTPAGALRGRCLPYSGWCAVLFRPGPGARVGWVSSSSSKLNFSNEVVLVATNCKVKKFCPRRAFARQQQHAHSQRKTRSSAQRCERTSCSRLVKQIPRSSSPRRGPGGCATEIPTAARAISPSSPRHCSSWQRPSTHSHCSELGHVPRRHRRCSERRARDV
jgi:hypothetical protein